MTWQLDSAWNKNYAAQGSIINRQGQARQDQMRFGEFTSCTVLAALCWESLYYGHPQDHVIRSVLIKEVSSFQEVV